MGNAIRTHSESKKKNSLLRLIGPPRLPPKWFTVERGFWFPGVALVKKSAAFRRAPFQSSYKFPWNWFVPDFVT